MQESLCSQVDVAYCPLKPVHCPFHLSDSPIWITVVPLVVLRYAGSWDNLDIEGVTCLIYIIRRKFCRPFQTVYTRVKIVSHIKRGRHPIRWQTKVLSYPRHIFHPFFWAELIPGQLAVLNVLIRISETCCMLHRPFLQLVPRPAHTYLANARFHRSSGACVSGSVVSETHEVLANRVQAMIDMVKRGRLSFPSAVLEESATDIFLSMSISNILRPQLT